MTPHQQIVVVALALVVGGYCQSTTDRIAFLSSQIGTSLQGAELAAVHDELAALYRSEGMHLQALQIGREGAALLEDGVDRAKLLVGVAQDLRALGRFGEASETLSTIPHRLHVPELLAFQASLMDCAGEASMALLIYEKALRASKSPSASDVLLHIDYLRKATRDAEGRGAPHEVLDGLVHRTRGAISSLIRAGPWESELQLPQHYIPNLPSSPFPQKTQWEAVREACEILEEAAGSLAAEYQALEEEGVLIADSECLNDKWGRWKRYETNAPWIAKDERGCGKHSPRACGAVEEIKRRTGLVVMRGGYSAIEAGTWIRPHHGVTNGQLKIHLGVAVPTYPNGTSCAHIRVADQMRDWNEGTAFVLDDSFEHEVWNNCGSTRVVFQLVFLRPDVAADAAKRETVLRSFRSSHRLG
eukprot:Sspe_Gene.7737::Locus_2623_Transcript_1_1_Confidence_1.000_Length_1505::g.7737::m.7737/K00476/ASPH; aspartate beta-hydroxylase